MLDTKFIEKFFHESLIAAKSYHIEVSKNAIKLDQNESPFDWPDEFKKLVLDRVMKMPWNRYPEPYADELVSNLAADLGCAVNQLLLGPGSNYLLALMMESLTQKQNGEIVLARPSFALYETHAQYLGLKYRTWDLDQNFEYQTSQLSDLKPYSLVIFASPNNPVGNVLAKKDFEELLESNPSSIFIADEAYYEFHDENYFDLLNKHANLILVRTFSKALGAAGLRCGYLVAHQDLITQFKKIGVPYLLNYFSVAACSAALVEKDLKNYFAQIVKESILERERVFATIEESCKNKLIFIKPSKSNSLLLKWSNSQDAAAAHKYFLENNIIVRNVSKGPGLAGCLRVSIGNRTENDLFIQLFKKLANF